MSEIDPKFDRVTAPLYFISGLSKISPEVLDNAARRGSEVHIQCAAIASGMGCPGYGEWAGKIDGYVCSFELWAMNKKFLPTPERLYSDEYMITGEIDGLYENKHGQIVLYDLKTPLNISKSWPLQLSAYSYLLSKEGITIERMEVVKLDKKGRDANVYEYENDFETYVECLNIYRKFLKNQIIPLDIDYL